MGNADVVPTCGHLVAEAAAAAVDHHAHLALMVDAHLLGSVVVVDLVHHLDLSVVVPRTQGAQLGETGMDGLKVVSAILGRNINYPVHLICPPDPLAARPVSRTSKKHVSVGQPVLRDHTQ